MLTTTKTANINGQSNIGDVVAAYLGANIQSDGSVSISKTIPNVALYTKNQTDIEVDVKAFEAQAIAVAQGGIA